MAFSPGHRKFWLSLHIAASVGWLGAVVAYLALDLTAATSQDPQKLRAAYVAMDLVTRWVLLPLASAALATGLVVALGSRWGLFRHYWVLVSLALTAVALGVLLVEAQTIRELAVAAADPATSTADLRALPSTLVHSVGGLVVLLVVLALNVYKPRGVTPYGWRKQQKRAQLRRDGDKRDPGPPR